MTKKDLIEKMALEFSSLISEKRFMRKKEELLENGKTDTNFTLEFVKQTIIENDIQHLYLDQLVKQTFNFTKANLIDLNKRIDVLQLEALK